MESSVPWDKEELTDVEKTDIIKKSITDRYEKISSVIEGAYGG
jgi:hypothetical protein